MRFVFFGAGAVGGAVGGRLAQAGHRVVLIARHAVCSAIRERGLRLEAPDSIATVYPEVAESPEALSWTPEDIVFLSMKTQDAAPAVQALAALAPADVPVVCMQNAVENERIALRYFENVYGVCVMCPAAYLTPGIVQAWCAPVTGILDIGRYPSGVDDTARQIAATLETASFVSLPRPDIMRWKYSKLLMNLGNALEAVCGPSGRRSRLGELARAEALAAFAAAGIDYVSEEDDRVRRGDLLRSGPIGEKNRQGGSSWQSLKRRIRNIEADYFNGEIVLLGRLHGVPTPVNRLLQVTANEMARSGREPGTIPLDELLALLDHEATR